MDINEEINKQYGRRNRKWVVVGKGYSGGLATWMRGKYPNLVHAAWSSSGQVNIEMDLWKYDEYVHNITYRNRLPCQRLLRNIVNYMDNANDDRD